MTMPAKRETPTPATIDDVLNRGDLSDLTPAQRTEYTARVCHSLGMNPLTRPFQYLTLNGKLMLYATRDAADQLRKLNGISIKIVDRAMDDGLYTVHVQATDKTGRTDEDFGVVPYRAGAGEILANSIMKAVTKAKRRVTLSISGLGFMDETEIQSTGGTPEDAHDIDDEIPDRDAAEPERKLSFEAMAREAASHGKDQFDLFYSSRTRNEQELLRLMKPELEKLIAKAPAQV